LKKQSKKKTEIKLNIQDEEQKKPNINEVKSWFSIKNVLKYFKNKSKYNESLIIRMETTSGHHEEFIIQPTNSFFIYKKGQYIIDDKLKYYISTYNLYGLDFHQELSLPVGRKIDVNKIQKVLRTSGVTDVDNAVNPQTLRLFQESNVIQKVLMGDMLIKVINQIKIALVIIGLITLITMGVIIKMSDMLNNIHF